MSISRASGDPDYEDSTYVQNTPYTFQNGNGNVELMLTGPGHGKRQIVYRFKMSDYPAVQLGDRLTFKFNATCNHSFANPIIRVVERHSGIQVLSVPFTVSTPNLYVENIITFTLTDPHMEVIVESQNPNVSLSNHLLVRDWTVYWKEKHVDVVQNPTDTAYWTKDSYRYGFQGQEADNEINGLGNTWNYTYRMHNAKLGRFLSLDPLAPDYPHNSPYAFSENRVIDAVELEGLENVGFEHRLEQRGVKLGMTDAAYHDMRHKEGLGMLGALAVGAGSIPLATAAAPYLASAVLTIQNSFSLVANSALGNVTAVEVPSFIAGVAVGYFNGDPIGPISESKSFQAGNLVGQATSIVEEIAERTVEIPRVSLPQPDQQKVQVIESDNTQVEIRIPQEFEGLE